MSRSVEMTTDQDLPVGQSAVAAAFAVRGVDVSPNQDRGVVKVFSSATSCYKSVCVCVHMCGCLSGALASPLCRL